MFVSAPDEGRGRIALHASLCVPRQKTKQALVSLSLALSFSSFSPKCSSNQRLLDSPSCSSVAVTATSVAGGCTLSAGCFFVQRCDKESKGKAADKITGRSNSALPPGSFALRWIRNREDGMQSCRARLLGLVHPPWRSFPCAFTAFGVSEYFTKISCVNIRRKVVLTQLVSISSRRLVQIDIPEAARKSIQFKKFHCDF